MQQVLVNVSCTAQHTSLAVHNVALLAGIAYDGNVSVYLTGKDFPRMWEIQLAEPPANADLAVTRQTCKPSS